MTLTQIRERLIQLPLAETPNLYFPFFSISVMGYIVKRLFFLTMTQPMTQKDLFPQCQKLTMDSPNIPQTTKPTIILQTRMPTITLQTRMPTITPLMAMPTKILLKTPLNLMTPFKSLPHTSKPTPAIPIPTLCSLEAPITTILQLPTKRNPITH